MPPSGRIKKPMPKVPVVSSSEAYRLSAGKNNRDMTTVRKPKTKKSYHSSAFPIAAAAIWRIFGADRLAGLVAKSIISPLDGADDPVLPPAQNALRGSGLKKGIGSLRSGSEGGG